MSHQNIRNLQLVNTLQGVCAGGLRGRRDDERYVDILRAHTILRLALPAYCDCPILSYPQEPPSVPQLTIFHFKFLYSIFFYHVTLTNNIFQSNFLINEVAHKVLYFRNLNIPGSKIFRGCYYIIDRRVYLPKYGYVEFFRHELNITQYFFIFCLLLIVFEIVKRETPKSIYKQNYYMYIFSL